jgi:diguanylate cyclase (GGDEF)-like protein/PAS domain S-box-containing protein
MGRFRSERGRAMVPFLAVALVGPALMAFPPYSDVVVRRQVLVLVLCGVCTVALALASVRLPEASWAAAVPILAFFLVVVAARDVTGGSLSPLSPLVLLPILWIVLFGTRRQLWVAVVASGAVFLGPLLVLGTERYNPGEWRRALLWSLVVGLICPRVQERVVELRAAVLRQTQLAGQMNAVLQAATEHLIVTTDLEGSITLFGEGAERMVGYRAEEMLGGTPLLMHVGDEVAARAAELGIDPGFAVLVHDVPADRAAVRVWTFRRQDGTTLRVLLSVTRLFDGDVQTGWLGIARDITAEELAQRDLELAERRWRVLVDHMPDMSVMVIGPQLEYRLAVGAGLGRQGLEQVAGSTLFESSSPAIVDLLEPLYRAALAGETGVVEISAPNTSAIHEVTAVPLPPHHGRPEALVVARDITRSREREAALRVTRDRFAQLVEVSPHGLLLMDADLVIVEANPAICAMLGFVAVEVIGHRLSSLPWLTDQDLSRLGDLAAGAVSRLSVEREVEAAASDVHFVAVTVVPLRGAEQGAASLLATVVDISERRRYEERLAHLADHDPLTGVANRRKFDAELEAHLNRCRRHGARGALMMLDLDHFKRINDTMGHNSGDELIVSVATILRKRLRVTDVLARLGGDEFAILLPDADAAAAEVVAGQLVALIRDHVTVMDDTHPRSVTASVGVVLITDRDISAAALAGAADRAMYDAKDAGRDGYVLTAPRRDLRPGVVRP